MKKIAACYIRVSTDDQTELSPSSQLEALQEYADSHGYIIPEEYVFKDEGISGRTTKKRPEFNRMIGVAKTKPKPFDAVLLWKFSRFARNRTDAIVYKNLLRNELGIDVISISESLGDDRGTALILESMFEAMDEYYSINLSTEVKRSMKMKAEKGQPLCIPPFGYK
ncbi:MAG: recombinase family protein, partial [Oscillospiraceae bacterium]|nr:recombinase family protein [Oscillospiraceae bacterium]